MNFGGGEIFKVATCAQEQEADVQVTTSDEDGDDIASDGE